MVVRILTVALAIASMLPMTGCENSQADPRVPAPPAECELRIEVPAKIKQDAHGQIKVRINNVGSVPVTLVLPGDGSEVSWRTPTIRWELKPLDATDANSKLPLHLGRRCGNINQLDPRVVFTLKPGESRELSQWVNLPYGMPPGKYRAVFHYSNVPDMKWQGVSLGKHDKAAMRLVKRSTPISLVSNEVIVEIIE